nr:hypothetical protein [uncultured Amphritea sp.]
MDFTTVKDKAKALFAEAGFISRIDSDADYVIALELMDNLIDDYDANRPLIDILAASIERWEDSALEFEQFNARVASLGESAAVSAGSDNK